MKFWNLHTHYTADELFADPALLWEASCEYFAWVDAHPWHSVKSKTKGKTDRNNEALNDNETETRPMQRPYSLSGLCVYLNCPQSRFRKFKAECTHNSDFANVIARIEGVIETQLLEGVAIGIFSAGAVSKGLPGTDKAEPTTPPDDRKIIWEEKKTYVE